MAENITQIPLKDYPKQTDEVLYEIMSFYGQSHEMYGGQIKVHPQYKYAYELLQLRQNKALVDQTERLVNKTLTVAKWTRYVGIGTAVLAVAALIALYLRN